jgi:hypothetical protein
MLFATISIFFNKCHWNPRVNHSYNQEKGLSWDYVYFYKVNNSYFESLHKWPICFSGNIDACFRERWIYRHEQILGSMVVERSGVIVGMTLFFMLVLYPSQYGELSSFTRWKPWPIGSNHNYMWGNYYLVEYPVVTISFLSFGPKAL